jgi:lysosomal alpha-mannosidase
MTSGAEFEWTIGPIPHADGLGKEIITRYATPLATNGEWVSDSNCRDSMRRKRDYRPTWNITIYEPVADNYVPVNCFQSIADASTGVTLTVSTDRSNGGSSIVDGSLEIMVHRRLLRDDNRGVGEPLNETGINGLGLIARGLHLVSLDSAATAGVSRRTNVANQLSKPIVAYTALPGGSTAAQWLQTHNSSYAGVVALPANVHLLTVQAYNPRSWLVRLAHSYEAGEDAVNSQPATVSLATLFTGFSVSGAVEMTLTGNQPLAQAPTVTYDLDDGTSVTLPVVPAPPQGAAMSVTLNPMEIRTFLVTVAQV